MPPEVLITFSGPKVLIELLRYIRRTSLDSTMAEDVALGAQQLSRRILREPGVVPTRQRDIQAMVQLRLADPRSRLMLDEHRTDVRTIFNIGYDDWVTRSFPRELWVPLGQLRADMARTFARLGRAEGGLRAYMEFAQLLGHRRAQGFLAERLRRLNLVGALADDVLERLFPLLDEAAGRTPQEVGARISPIREMLERIRTGMANALRGLRRTEEFIDELIDFPRREPLPLALPGR